MQQQKDRTEAIAKLREMIKDIKFAMMTSVDDHGSLHSRPMTTQQSEFDGDLWFFTDKSTPKVDEIAREHRVNVSYADPSDDRYVSVSGMAEVVEDRAKMKELWNPAYKAWFPDGLEDPDLVLLKVSVQEAEYWDSPKSGMVKLFGFAKAIVTGQTYDAGENRKLDLEK